MNSFTVGDGPLSAILVGGIHGDEPCGPEAIARFRQNHPPLSGSVKCILANSRAIEQGARYVDTDLNRAFPGDAKSSVYEERLAAKLFDELDDVPILSFHSTQSTSTPFGLVNGNDAQAMEIANQLPIEHIVDCGEYTAGRFVDYPRVVEVECGTQWSEGAVETATELTYAFLKSQGIIDGDVPDVATTVYTLTGTIQKRPDHNYTVEVENFTHVSEGTLIAESDAGHTIRAEEPFTPVLVSANGYQHILGHTAQQSEI